MHLVEPNCAAIFVHLISTFRQFGTTCAKYEEYEKEEQGYFSVYIFIFVSKF